MKSYIKGIIIGLFIGAVVATVPAVAESIDALFNIVRININGIDHVQWGEEIKLDNGLTAPSNILYNDTTYLPIRKISELTGNMVYWNGDSKTVSITGEQQEVQTITKKPDKNGNMWEYYTFKVEVVKDPRIEGARTEYQYYIGVKDEARGYERIYRIINRSLSVTDSGIYFVKVNSENEYGEHYTLIKISFNNDENSQDGEELYGCGSSGFVFSTGFDGEWLFLAGKTPDNSSRAMIKAHNCITGKEVNFFGERWTRAYNLDVVNNGNISTLQFEYGTTGPTFNKEITFDKTTETFGEMRTVEQGE